MEPNNYENLKMKQTTKGGFFAKKGFNIETSPDDVSFIFCTNIQFP